MVDNVKVVKPAKKKNGMMFDSTAQRVLTICQGEIAMKNMASRANLVPSRRCPAMKIRINERMPDSIMGSLTATGPTPRRATKGIKRYAYRAFCPLPQEIR